MNSEQQLATITADAPVTGGFESPLSHARVLNGSFIMLIGSALVSIINFTYNVVVARKLGPADFGNVSAIATLLMMGSALTQSFQLVCAKFVARNGSLHAKSLVYRGLLKNAWAVSIFAAAVLILARDPLAVLLKMPSGVLIAMLGVAIAFSAPMGVKRGGLQGQYQFAPLASTFVIESGSKFIVALLLLYMGYGVLGAVGAIMASVIIAYWISPTYIFPRQRGAEEEVIPASFREGMQAIVFFVGQVMMSNIDILLVKHFFDPQRAGLYAAVALVGRLLYFAAWQVVSAMFPISAASKPGEKNGHMLLTPLLLVAGMAVAFILILTLAPKFIIGTLFGENFLQAEALFGLYAAATGIYALAVVLMTYEMSRRIANTGWLQLVMSGLMALCISIFHDTLEQVIIVQIVLMSTLLFAVSLPFVRIYWRSRFAEAA
jgi:O-antigen/teichoic acid export membrane protein